MIEFRKQEAARQKLKELEDEEDNSDLSLLGGI
jgi:hypothetical protein